MRCRLLVLVLVLAPVLLVAAGCSPKPLQESKTLTLDKEWGARALDIPAQKKAMKMTVEFSSSDGEVTVLVFKAADIKTEDELIMTGSTKALGSKRAQADSFTVDVPENTATRVTVRQHSAAKTDVALKVTGGPP
jgi:hypothetical protein